jgi:hypothetical protein
VKVIFKHNIKAVAKSIKAKAKAIRTLVDTEVMKEAHRTHKDLTEATPVGYTGKTRRGWKVKRFESGNWIIRNDTKVIQYLEHGTKAHGAKTQKRLYLPLKAGPWRTGYRRGMKWGTHFVMAKRVRGIKALNLIGKQHPKTTSRFKRHMKLIRQRVAAIK